MSGIYILQNLQLRIVVSWVTIRYIPQIFNLNMELFPLILLTLVSTIFIGYLLREQEEVGIKLEQTSFIPIDARSPRIEDDILVNDRHMEIVITDNGVKINQ